jgi:CDP-diacylglycerol--glycerol-3-phosphate 3-phosphatidyltransferase
MNYIPTALVIFRFLVGPFLLWDSLDGQTTIWFVLAYIAAFFSDIFDGIIARRLGVSTAKLRQADSWADVTLYVCIAISAWLVRSGVLIAFRFPLLSVLGCQLVWWIVNLLKYGKPASYHTYSAKLWGITLFIATIALFGFNYSAIALSMAIVVGIVHTIEEIIMTLILPEWTHDVLSIFHALEIIKSKKYHDSLSN